MMSMVRANNITNVPIESKLMRCSMSNNPANKPESIENNKQPPVCHRCRRLWLHSMTLVLLLLLVVVVLMLVLFQLVFSFGWWYCCRISCCKWFKPNFPNNLNVESSASVDSIVSNTRWTPCSIAYKLLHINSIGTKKEKEKLYNRTARE